MRRVRRLRRPEASLCVPRNRVYIRSEVRLAQIVHHALKRPILGIFDKPMADWVVSNIQPFHITGVIAPRLTIPKAPEIS